MYLNDLLSNDYSRSWFQLPRYGGVMMLPGPEIFVTRMRIVRL